MNENEAITVTLTLENDEELECAVLSIFEAEEREYIALLPLDENGDNDDGQVFLLSFHRQWRRRRAGSGKHRRRSGI